MADECRDVLLERNLSLLKYSLDTRIFVSSLVDREFYDEHKSEFGGSYAGFGVDFDQFSQSYENVRSQYQFSLSQQEALTALTMTALPGSVEAWSQCMAEKRRDLFCWVEGSPSERSFTLWVEWAPATAVGGAPLTDVRATMSFADGKVVEIPGFPDALNQGRTNVIVSRGDTPVRGQIAGKAGVGSFATSFFAPYFLPPPGLSPDPYYLCIRHDECFQRQETVHGGLTFGQPYWQATAFIGNDEYTGNCIGLHPPVRGRAKAYFTIPAGARWFRSIVGLARQDTTHGDGNAVVAVDVDGQRQWTERIAGSTKAGIHVNTGNIGIPEGAKLLTLISDADGDNWNDHVLWARPAFSAQPIV